MFNNVFSCHRCEQSTKIAISYSISSNVCLFSQNIHMTTHKEVKYTRDSTSKNEAGRLFWHLFSSLFPSKLAFYPFFHWHIKSFFFFQNVAQVLVLEELLTICSLEARRWRWPASIVNFGQSFVKEQKQPSQIEMCRCWPWHVFQFCSSIFCFTIVGLSCTFGPCSSFWLHLIVLVSISGSFVIGMKLGRRLTFNVDN